MRYLPVLIAVGAAIYLAIWYLQRRADGRRPGGAPRPTRTPRRPLAPDDDPDFLAELDRRGREARRRRNGGSGAEAASGTGSPDATTADPGAVGPGAPGGGESASDRGAAGPTREADEGSTGGPAGPARPEPDPRDTGREVDGNHVEGPGLDGDASR